MKAVIAAVAAWESICHPQEGACGQGPPSCCALKSCCFSTTDLEREFMASWLWLDSLTALPDSLSITIKFKLLSPRLPASFHSPGVRPAWDLVASQPPTNPSSLLTFPHLHCPYLILDTAEPFLVLGSAFWRTQTNSGPGWELRKQFNRRWGSGSSPTWRGKRMTSWSVPRIHALLGTGHGPVTEYFTEGVQRRVNITGRNLLPLQRPVRKVAFG